MQAEAQKAELLKRQATLAGELQRLTDSLAAGGESRSLRQGITLREAEAARIDRGLARIARGTATRSAEAATQVLEALLPEWRAALRKHAPEARQMLRKLVTGRVVVTPEERQSSQAIACAASQPWSRCSMSCCGATLNSPLCPPCPKPDSEMQNRS